MSTTSPVIYGGDTRRWGQDPWAAQFIAETFSLSLSEDMTPSEAELFSVTVPLGETVALTDAQVKTLLKVLADSGTLSDAAVALAMTKVLADSGALTDTNAVIFTVKNMSDFIVLKEWISIQLHKSLTWVAPGTAATSWTGPGTPPTPIWIDPEANANIFDTLWGQYQYGRVLFGGLKPQASWARGSRRQENWTNSNGHKYNS